MKKIIFTLLSITALLSCAKNEEDNIAGSSPWDNTAWTFTGKIEASTDVDPEFQYFVSFPEGLSVDIKNARKGEFTSDWFAACKMTLQDNGDIRLYDTYSGSQNIDMGGEKMQFYQSITQEMIISRVDENHAKGYYNQTQKITMDGDGYEGTFSGVLDGVRTK